MALCIELAFKRPLASLCIRMHTHLEWRSVGLSLLLYTIHLSIDTYVLFYAWDLAYRTQLIHTKLVLPYGRMPLYSLKFKYLNCLFNVIVTWKGQRPLHRFVTAVITMITMERINWHFSLLNKIDKATHNWNSTCVFTKK